MAKARRWKGAKSFRRLLKNMPNAMHAEMEDVLDEGSLDIQRAMVARTPRRSGALRAGIKRRVLRKSLSAKIGLIGTPRGRARLFYGRILDLGRRSQLVTARRRKPSGGISTYVMRVRGTIPLHFVTGRYIELRTIIGRRLKGVWDRALNSLAGGSDD